MPNSISVNLSPPFYEIHSIIIKVSILVISNHVKLSLTVRPNLKNRVQKCLGISADKDSDVFEIAGSRDKVNTALVLLTESGLITNKFQENIRSSITDAFAEIWLSPEEKEAGKKATTKLLKNLMNIISALPEKTPTLFSPVPETSLASSVESDSVADDTLRLN